VSISANHNNKPNKQTMNTYQKISSLTPEQVTARLHAADDRYRKAISRITNIFSRHNDAEIIAPRDVVLHDLPIIDPAPNEVTLITNVSYYHRGCFRNEKLPVNLRNYFLDYDSLVFPSASPANIVAGIRAADAYAEMAEKLAEKYIKSVNKLIEKHVKEQSEVVKELEGLVAQLN
jgi:hypothetical protein